MGKHFPHYHLNIGLGFSLTLIINQVTVSLVEPRKTDYFEALQLVFLTHTLPFSSDGPGAFDFTQGDNSTVQ